MSKYIELNKFLSNDYPTTFIIGARGVGKTINALSYFISQAFEQDKYFIYLRRFQIEIDTLNLDTALLSKLTGYDITVEMSNQGGATQKVIQANGKTVAIMLALSVSGKYKSNSFASCFYVVYDEFIDIRNRYVKNEVNIFYNFMMTIFRDFSAYKVLFLANATDAYNEYFLNLNILPKSTITKFRQIGVKIVMYETSKELDDERLNTPLAKQYSEIFGLENSALTNIFDNKYNDFLGKIPSKASYKATLKLNGAYYGLFTKGDKYFISHKKDPKNKNVKVLFIDDISNNEKMCTNDFYLSLFNHFKQAKLFFDNERLRTIFIKYFKSPYTGGI